jgi:mannitol-specific phosphotransferase system IIBC component
LYLETQITEEVMPDLYTLSTTRSAIRLAGTVPVTSRQSNSNADLGYSSSGNRTAIIAGATVAAFISLAVALLIIIIWRRKQHTTRRESLTTAYSGWQTTASSDMKSGSHSKHQHQTNTVPVTLPELSFRPTSGTWSLAPRKSRSAGNLREGIDWSNVEPEAAFALVPRSASAMSVRIVKSEE